MLTLVSPNTWYEISPRGPSAKISAMAAVKGGEISGSSTTASSARPNERGAVRPVAEQAAHGVEARPSVPEGQQEQAAQRVENEQGHRPPDQHDGRGDDRIALHSLITSFTQRSTSRLRLLPTQSRSTGSSLASFMRLCTAGSTVAPGS